MTLAAPHFSERCAECSFRTLHLFCNIGDDALRRLDEIGMHVAMPGHTVVFKESQPATSVFVVCEGQLKLSASSRDGHVMILRLAGGGDLLGLSAVLNDVQYEVTAETLEPTVLKRIRRATFSNFVQTFVEVSKNTLQVLAKENRELFLDARRLALSGSASGRLARLLLDWAASVGSGKPELRFTVALTHEELANMAGTSRETVTRLLNQYERDRFIVRYGASIVILSPDQLDMLAG